MDAHWVNGRAEYRCRHGHSSARPTLPGRTGNLYVREDILLIELIQRLVVVDGDACDSRALEIVAHLRSQAAVIVHDDSANWSVAAWDEG